MQQLTIEQEFTIQSFNSQVNGMSRKQAIAFLKDLHRSYIVQKSLYNSLLKEAWNIGAPIMDGSKPTYIESITDNIDVGNSKGDGLNEPN